MKVIVAWDGDHIGREVGRASLNDDMDGLRRISQAIELGNKIWESWVVMNGGSIISMGGDEGRAEIQAETLGQLPAIQRQYADAVNSSVSVGVGTKLSEADKALLVAKHRGGDQIVLWTEDLQPELEEIHKAKNQQSHDQKLADEYFAKNAGQGAEIAKLPQAGGGGIAGASQPGQASVMKPTAEASEHSQGEAMSSIADDAPKQEMTHSAQDLEDQFHSLAQEQEMAQQAPETQGMATGPDQIKLQVAKVLMSVKEQAPILEQVKQSAPDTYAAVMNLVSAVIAMAKEMNGSGQHTSVKEIQDRAKSNAMVSVPQPPQEGEEKESDTKKSEAGNRVSSQPRLRSLPAHIQRSILMGKTPHDMAAAIAHHEPEIAKLWGDREFIDCDESANILSDALQHRQIHHYSMIGTNNTGDSHAWIRLSDGTDLDPTNQGMVSGQVSGEYHPAAGIKGAIAPVNKVHPSVLKSEDGLSQEVREGVEMEMESGIDHAQALTRALDNLERDPEYYKKLKADLEKASLNMNSKPSAPHHHLNLPVGSQVDSGPAGTSHGGRVKVQHPETGKQSWVQVRSGQVMSADGHPISSRNPGGK